MPADHQNEPFDVVVAGGQVVSSIGRCYADVGIRGEHIAAVGSQLDTSGARVIDASDCLVLPGAVDAHVHPIHAETLASVSEAAAFGGVTTLLHHVYVDSDSTLMESLAGARAEAEAGSVLDFGFHARLTEVPRRLAELPSAVEFGVRSFKLFTAYRSRGIMTDDDDLLLAMERIAALHGLAMVHAENGAIIDVLEARFREQGRTRPEDYPATRPPEAEAEAVHRTAVIARLAGCPLYVVHISCASALAEVVAARVRGQEVYAETCPHYLTLTAEEAMPRFGARAKIAPPLRTGADRSELWRAVADGRIDVVASDHSAFVEAEKVSPTDNVLDVGFGAPGIEEMLPLLFEASVHQGCASLERLVAVLAEAPARIFQLPTKGRVAPGMDADLVVFDPQATRTLGSAALHGNAYYSLYAGRSVHGLPRTVLQRGAVIVDADRLVAHSGQGRFLRAGTASAPVGAAS